MHTWRRRKENHPAPIGMADQTQKTKLLAHCAWLALPSGAGTSECHYYWCTDPPWANSISAPKKIHLAGPQSKQSARLSLQLSELGPPPPPNPLNLRWVCPPFGTREDTEDTLAYRRGGGWGPNTRGQTLWYSRYVSCNKFHIVFWRTEHFGAPSYFHPNRLLTLP